MEILTWQGLEIFKQNVLVKSPPAPILGEPGLKVPQNCYPLGKSSRNSDRDYDVEASCEPSNK